MERLKREMERIKADGIDSSVFCKHLACCASEIPLCEDPGLSPAAVAQLKQIGEIFNCDLNDPVQLNAVLLKIRGWADTGREPEEIERVMDAEKRTVRLRSDLSARLAATKDIPIDRLLEIAIAERDGRLKIIDMTGKCGSCKHYRRIDQTACGSCLKHPYAKDVICDPKAPYWTVGRSRVKCKLYEAAVGQMKGAGENG